MIKIMKYDSDYLFEKRPELIGYLKDNLNNLAEGLYDVGSGMMTDLNCKKKAVVFIAWECGAPVAWANLTNRSFDDKMQISLYVHPNYRRQGIGSRIIQKVKKWTKENEKEVCCQPWNCPGTSFYSKAGITTTDLWEFDFPNEPSLVTFEDLIGSVDPIATKIRRI